MSDPHLLMISHLKEDLAFGQQISLLNGYRFSAATHADDVRRLLVTYPGSLVFWNAESTAQYRGVMEVLPKYARPRRVFAVTQKSFYVYPHLYKQPIFGHYLYRRFGPAALAVYSKLAAAAFEKEPFGLERYLAEDSEIQRIVIQRSIHKRSAIDAIQNVLTRQGVRGRLAALVAQATDELILNAIFDAPVEKGKPTRKQESRDADIALGEREAVKIEIGHAPEYVGVSVTDQFGSLNRRIFLDSLRKQLGKEGSATTKAQVGESGFGLHGIVQSGLSLVLVSKPAASTQMILFFPKVESYKDFRTGFRFMSLLAD